jgi:ubiquinone/menaquinone biosynthesis C-methylase UbiE
MSIDKHYDQSLDPSWILQQVHSVYPAGADLFQLAPLDQLHIGGIKASERLLRHLDLARHRHILDIGSGAGGLMRQASAMGFSMIGLDITHRFNQLNLGLNGCFSAPVGNPIITGDAHHLPFADQSLDLILFQHSFLNMPDNFRVLSECRRVLKPGGTLLMHEVVCGPQPEQMRYPVPWADDAVHSHLVTAQTLQQQLQQAGFVNVQLDDWSDEALAWRHRQLQKEEAGHVSRAALSPALILGSRFAAMGKNLVLNLEAGAIRVIELVATRS